VPSYSVLLHFTLADILCDTVTDNLSWWTGTEEVI